MKFLIFCIDNYIGLTFFDKIYWGLILFDVGFLVISVGGLRVFPVEDLVGLMESTCLIIYSSGGK